MFWLHKQVTLHVSASGSFIIIYAVCKFLSAQKYINKSHEMQVARIQPKGSSSYQYFSLVRQVQILVLFTFKFCLNVSTLFFLSQFSLVVLARIFYPVAQMVICIWKHLSSSSSSSKGNNRGTLVKPGRPTIALPSKRLCGCSVRHDYNY